MRIGNLLAGLAHGGVERGRENDCGRRGHAHEQQQHVTHNQGEHGAKQCGRHARGRCDVAVTRRLVLAVLKGGQLRGRYFLDGRGFYLTFEGFNLVVKGSAAFAGHLVVAVAGRGHAFEFGLQPVQVAQHVRGHDAVALLAGERFEEELDGRHFPDGFVVRFLFAGQHLEASGQARQVFFAQLDPAHEFIALAVEHVVRIHAAQFVLEGFHVLGAQFLDQRIVVAVLFDKFGDAFGLADDARGFGFEFSQSVAAALYARVQHLVLFAFALDVFEKRDGGYELVAFLERGEERAVVLVEVLVQAHQVLAARFEDVEHFALVVHAAALRVQGQFALAALGRDVRGGFFHEPDAEHVVQHLAAVAGASLNDVKFFLRDVCGVAEFFEAVVEQRGHFGVHGFGRIGQNLVRGDVDHAVLPLAARVEAAVHAVGLVAHGESDFSLAYVLSPTDNAVGRAFGRARGAAEQAEADQFSDRAFAALVVAEDADQSLLRQVI